MSAERKPFVIRIDADKCVACGECCQECPTRAIEQPPDGGVPKLAHSDRCIGCGHCCSVCPCEAIAVEGQPSSDPASPPLTFDQISSHVKFRRSVRRYAPEPPPRAVLEKLFDVARYAPTGGNAQNVNFISVTAAEHIEAIKKAMLTFLRAASANPALPPFIREKMGAVLKSCEKGSYRSIIASPCLLMAWSLPFAPSATTDVPIALETVELVAPTLGLATCWAGFINIGIQTDDGLKALMRDRFKIPVGSTVQCLMIGTPTVHHKRIPPRPAPRVTWA